LPHVSPVRIALLHAAAATERMRRRELQHYHSLAIRIEYLALGTGMTIRPTPDETRAWRRYLAKAAAAVIGGAAVAGPGPRRNDGDPHR